MFGPAASWASGGTDCWEDGRCAWCPRAALALRRTAVLFLPTVATILVHSSSKAAAPARSLPLSFRLYLYPCLCPILTRQRSGPRVRPSFRRVALRRSTRCRSCGTVIADDGCSSASVMMSSRSCRRFARTAPRRFRDQISARQERRETFRLDLRELFEAELRHGFEKLRGEAKTRENAGLVPRQGFGRDRRRWSRIGASWFGAHRAS